MRTPFAGQLLALIVFSSGAALGQRPDFGHALVQVDALLRDRPALRSGLTEDDPLRAWVLARFASGDGARRVYWDATLPPDGVNAQHLWGDTIRVRLHPEYQQGAGRGARKRFVDAWADLIFELHNINQGRAFRSAWQAAVDGRISRRRWLEEVARAEHRALLYCQSFYRTRWRLWMRQRGQLPLGMRWAQILATPLHYHQWIAQYRDPDGYPFADYGAAYDAAFRQREFSSRGANPFELSRGLLPPRRDQ